MKNKIGMFFSLVLLFTLAGCIDDDEYQQPDRELPVITISDVTQEEGNESTVFEFTITLTGLNVTNAGVRFRTVDGTAKAGEDYVGILDSAIVLGPAQTEKTISIAVVADFFREEDEEFSVELYDPVNVTLDKEVGRAVILNDDTFEGSIFIPDGYITPEEYPGYNLVWQDEFEGATINEADWNFEIGTGNNGWGNNELQFYRRENASLYEGHLVIEAREENFSGSNYTSSRMTTQNKQTFRYGRVDIRAVLPETQGMWPALWMLGSSISEVGWPACGEIDIMEMRGQTPNRIEGTVHFGAGVAQHQFIGQPYTLSEGKFTNEFHVFSLIWEENSIRWLLDDEEFYHFTVDDIGNNPYPFNEEFFFIFNIAVGGNYVGSPDDSTVFPQTMIVDYIRVFQEE